MPHMYVTHAASAQREVKTPHFSANREAVVSKVPQAADERTEFFDEAKQRHENMKGVNTEVVCWERKLRRAIKNRNSKWSGIHDKKHTGAHASLKPHTQFVSFTSATACAFVSCLRSGSQDPHRQL